MYIIDRYIWTWTQQQQDVKAAQERNVYFQASPWQAPSAGRVLARSSAHKPQAGDSLLPWRLCGIYL